MDMLYFILLQGSKAEIQTPHAKCINCAPKLQITQT